MFGRKVKNFSLQREDKFSGKKFLDVLRGEIASEMKKLHKCFQNSVDQSMEGLEKKNTKKLMMKTKKPAIKYSWK